MRLKTITALLVAVFMVAPAIAQEPTPGFAGVISGSALAADNFSSWGGGIQIGTEFSLDADKWLSIRTLYTQWNVGSPGLEAIQATGLLNWYVGNRWAFYALMGADAWMDGEQSGTDLLIGFGMNRQVYRAGGDEWAVPFTVDVFGEMVFSDVDNPTGNFVQLNFGTKFTRPVRK